MGPAVELKHGSARAVDSVCRKWSDPSVAGEKFDLVTAGRVGGGAGRLVQAIDPAVRVVKIEDSLVSGAAFEAVIGG